MLWENTFYEDGASIADRIIKAVSAVEPNKVAALAVEARTKMKLRHVPLLLTATMAKSIPHRHLVADVLFDVIQRPDELSEFVSIYWSLNNGKKTLSAQCKRGLAKAFTKFNEYSLAKYNRDGAVKLRDVLFLCHAKPPSAEQDTLWKRLISNTLETPDTWEVELSASADKTESWKRLLKENKLGALALLKNIRNMREAYISNQDIAKAISSLDPTRVLPFRFISAARHNPALEPELEQAMFRCINNLSLHGKTVLLVDVSGSMADPLSRNSTVSRLDAACGLAVLAREACEKVDIFTFSNYLCAVPPRKGFALRDAITSSQSHAGTYLAKALQDLDAGHATNAYDRIIIFTDEQASTGIKEVTASIKGYIVNVASYENGIGYNQNWTHITGFSEAILDYITEIENLS
jgi:hypothetical protein